MTAAITRGLSLPEIDLHSYLIEGVERVMTPALAIYPDIVDSNIRATLRLMDGNANRWRPHVKTTKLRSIMKRFVEHGIVNFKCSTSLELSTVCEAGASDVLVAYPMVGANSRRVQEISSRFPEVAISALVESQPHVEQWRGSNIGLFIDVNPGMNRTGIEDDRVDEIVQLARRIQDGRQIFRGLHYYDGHLSSLDIVERERTAQRGYDRLMKVIAEFDRAGIDIGEVVTAGTPSFPCSLSYRPFAGAKFIHRASPGTIVYNDCSSLTQLPSEFGYQPAAVVVSTVVSHPSSGRLTCDAGHKTVSADSGIPTCAVLGSPALVPLKPSEEHLPIEAPEGSLTPPIGNLLYLVPRHICPTVNNFDHALIVLDGKIVGIEQVTARGREKPMV
ncbi:MAG TPA: alanine racemase [Blastocatellia bacterium]|nr:alanine racemase [Blastocatellia bacterium]